MTWFSDLREYVAIPQLTSLRLSPDGGWLAATVQTLAPDGKKWAASIWRVGTDGAAPVRLTRSVEGESGQEFLPDGSLLFASKRRAPGATGDTDADDAKAALWLLPAGGGEACLVTAPPGGVARLAVARQAHSYLLAAPAHPATNGADEDAARRKARSDAGVKAILHDAAPALVRYWDQDLGPDCLRLLAGAAAAADAVPDAGQGAGDTRDLTPDPGRALDEQSFGLSPDGALAVTGWQVPDAAGGAKAEIVVIDVATAQRSTLLAASGCDFDQPTISPDGRLVAAIRSEHDSYDRPGDVTLVIASTDGADGALPRDLLPGFDRRPLEVAWAPDGAKVYFTADDKGRRPVFVTDMGGEVMQVTTDAAAYDSLCPAPDGTSLYALRSSIGEPPTPVRIDVTVPGAVPVRLASPAGCLPIPGRVDEVAITVADGSAVRAWLALPDGASAASPAPLLLWVHGGPWMSWNSWSWRWNPWLMVARGYAVLLPDPALSTGYGQAFVARGHGTWGDKPYTDVMAITEAVTARADIDPSRTAMMGASFGGYMANWIAGHTGRFTAIVSHAGIWALDQMFGTTDSPYFWRRTFGDPATEPQRYLANSPHLHAQSIVTPTLIVHGDRDYRVPIGEALRMYGDLAGRGKKVKFLYFPNENHWILKPGDVRVWYETIFAFLAEHVLGQEWCQPELL